MLFFYQNMKRVRLLRDEWIASRAARKAATVQPYGVTVKSRWGTEMHEDKARGDSFLRGN